MKKTLLTLVTLLAATLATWAQGSDDFATLTANSSYKTGLTTTDGWALDNVAIQGHGETDSNPYFTFIPEGQTAVCINGKTSAVGTIKSPTIGGGIGTLTLNYGYAFGESNGVSFNVKVLKDGTEAFSQDIEDKTLKQKTAEKAELTVNVSGNNLQIVITNNCPSNSTSNKDRYSIWGIQWTAHEGGGEQTYVATPRFSLAEGTYYTLPFTVELTAAEGCTIYYALNGGTPAAYTQPIQLTAYGTYTLTAYAQDAQGNKSETISRTYTLAQTDTYTTLAQLKAACTATSQSEAPTVVLQARDFTVTAVGKSYTFISDPQGGAFLLYGSQTALKAGDKFQGSITGQLYIYKGTHELAFTDGLQNVTVTGQTELSPAVFSYDDFRYDNDESKLFILKNAKFKDGALTSSQVTVLDDETNEITLRDQFGILGSFNTEDTYNITMVSSKYSEAEVFYPTALENVTNQHQAESIANTPETAYTVARAIELTDAGESLTDSVYVKGIVSKVNTPKTFDGKLNIYVKDSSEAEADFEFYLCQNIGNQPFTTASDINVGDTLIAKGTLKKYNSTYELNSGCYLVSRKAIEVAPYEEYVPTGAGTEESPYTVADIIGIYENSQHIEGYQLPAEAVWATGTILGNVNTSTGATVVPDEEKPAVNSNLSLGNQDDGTHISVQLSAGEIRAALNILDNPGNLGKQVSVCGKIDKYCGIPGLKSLTAYSGIDLSISTVLSLIKSYVNGENKSIKMSDITTLIEKLAQQQQ